MNTTMEKKFTLFLWLVAVHSFLVGIGLIFSPFSLFEALGFSHQAKRFFPAQGGVFHIIMSIGYAIAAVRPAGSESLIVFIAVVKIAASVFLSLYFILVTPLILILLSFISDLLMGVIIIYYYGQLKRAAFFICGRA